LTEELVDQIGDGFESGTLPSRYKLAVRLADVIVSDPHGLDQQLRSDLLAEFDPAEIVELVLTTAVASAFSKAAIAWGPPPDMPTLDVPTPRPDGRVGAE
jgi:alkylhydroperoxidase family enzyme